jgi:hypothetical protein
MEINEEQRILAEAAVPGIVDEVDRLRAIISGARYWRDLGAYVAASACLNGLEDGVAEDLKSELDLCVEAANRLRVERDALRARIERLRRAYVARAWDPQATEDWHVERGILEPGDLVDPGADHG